MGRWEGILAAVASLFIVLLSSTLAAAGEPPIESWLRGSGTALEMRLHGELIDDQGQPVENVELVGQLRGHGRVEPVSIDVDGNRFEAWLPINAKRWHSLYVRATEKQSHRVAYLRLQFYQFRQAAIDGTKLTLASPTRQIKVQVVDEGAPVPNATVEAELLEGIEVRAQADGAGVAVLSLLPDQELRRLSAWTDDPRIGGYIHDRAAGRDAASNEQVVELEKCRDQTIRVVDDQGNPVAGVRLMLNVGTPPPNINYIGKNEDFFLTTNRDGEAICRSFPDWEKTFQYVELDDEHWHVNGDVKLVDGVVAVPVKRNVVRQTIAGKLSATSTSPGGFYVAIQSFQGEQENYSDEASVFTNADGSYEFKALPDATYCAFPLDARYAGETTDLIPYSTATGESKAPALHVQPGVKVDVAVTAGPNNKPLPGVHIGLSRRHEYSWGEGGMTRHGTSGPSWWIKTGADGNAVTYSAPGKLRASVFTSLWRTEETVDVAADQATTIRLHRELDGKRTLHGTLQTEGTAATAGGLKIIVGAVDGNFDERQTVEADADGRFAVETAAKKIGLFARTNDGSASAVAVIEDIDQPIVLTLRPTLLYHGQLLGKGDSPLPRHGVRAIVRIERDTPYNGIFLPSFEAARIDATTDDNGNFTIAGIPSEMAVRLHADALDDDPDGVYLEEFFLQPGETRPRQISRLAPNSEKIVAEPLAPRYQKLLRDCRLSNYRLMVIAADDAKGVKEFVDANLVGYHENKNVMRYMQFLLPQNDDLADDDRAFVASQGWEPPAENSVTAIVLDPEETELARMEFDMTSADATALAAEFVNKHAPPRHSALDAWSAALAEAKQTDRRVWARISGRYCGPCYRMSRWLDDHRELLEKDFVLVKIDESHDLDRESILELITAGKSGGIPFHAIFAADGGRLIDSEGPLGNIGHPSGYEGKHHLRQMLMKSKQRLTDAEVDELIESLEN